MATSDSRIELTFTLRRSTWEFLQQYLDDAAEGADVVLEDEKTPEVQQLNIETHNTTNTVRCALQTAVLPVESPKVESAPDWLTL